MIDKYSLRSSIEQAEKIQKTVLKFDPEKTKLVMKEIKKELVAKEKRLKKTIQRSTSYTFNL